MFNRANRLQLLGSAIFSEMDELRKKKENEGISTINLSIGSPDLPPAEHIRLAFQEEVLNQDNYRYTLASEFTEIKEAIVNWYNKRFQVILDPVTEVLPLMGSQDGLTHLGLAILNPDDLALVPDPGYPAYTTSVILAGAQKYSVPLLPENNYLPDYSKIPSRVAQTAKILFLNYPSNPLAAVADLEFFQRTIDFAKRFKIIVCHDLAYSELAYDGYKPPSILQVPEAKKFAVEFHSFSKTFSMAGSRLGFVVGNSEIISALADIKSNIDFGLFKPTLKAGIAALTGPDDWIKANAAIYKQRADILVDGFGKLGWEIRKPKASMFLWAPLPKGYQSSKEFSFKLGERTGVIVTPGVGFGEHGEGYIRMALVGSHEYLRAGVERIGRAFF
ncbi:MAG: aminotransferase class I/II-fold pyridoxal phosphate-dependent enzyme [Bacillota bacterium]